MTDNNFEPRIVAFCCRYCAYAAGDLAGAMRLPYPPNIRVILVPCTGRVDALHMMQALECGADGVYVAGCMENECHFISGNLKVKQRVARVQKTLAAIGMDPARLAMYNLSSAMGPRFAEIAGEMTDRIKALGPSPVGLNRTPAAAQSNAA